MPSMPAGWPAPSDAPGRLTAGEASDVLAGHLADLDDRAAQVALALAALVSVEVLLAGLAALELARGGHAEPLLGALVGLLLGHGSQSCSRRTRSAAK